ncbi:hypothetical protein BHE74_00025903 [Ensete ventricosum]|nr:hypothetical protein GW17_00057929 [Ensete ventricosum]RWW66711.1 hypothetical protein BHE74_00025903 [Ensete ventricosum]RZS17887.1 hypothetical protein BHM03_00050092 [Ensete ventricosum]
MGETEYLNSLIYPVEELCTSSKTLRRNLMEDKSCQILTMVTGTTESRLSASFPNKMLIENGNDANLLGSDN